MIETEDIIGYFPQIIPRGTIRVTDEEHRIDTDRDSNPYVVRLAKAPVERVIGVSGTVDGFDYTFEDGVDYDVINDDDRDGHDGLDSIDFTIGGKQPDDGSVISVTYVAESVINRYADAHDDVTSVAVDDIEDVVESRQVNHATGEDLDRVGALFGELGRRRGRSDSEYRQFLKSIVQSFSGRGTKPGIRFAVAAGLGVEDTDIEISEEFDNVEYTVIIYEWPDHTGSTVEDMAQLADPAGVEQWGTSYRIDPEEQSSSDSVRAFIADRIVEEIQQVDDVVIVNITVQETFEVVETTDDITSEATVGNATLHRWDRDSWDSFDWDGRAGGSRMGASDLIEEDVSLDAGTDDSYTEDAIELSSTTTQDEPLVGSDDISSEASLEEADALETQDSVEDDATDTVSGGTVTGDDLIDVSPTNVAWDVGSWGAMNWT